MLGRFLRWWGEELAALLPRWLRSSAPRQGNALCLDVHPGEVVVSHREGGREQALGRVALDHEGLPAPADRERLQALTAGLRPESIPCEATVAPELGLVKEVELPAAAEENLHQVLTFEMERLTPFRAADVYFDHRVISRDGALLRVRLALAPRAVVDRAIGLLPDWDLRVAERPSRAGGGDLAVTLTFLAPVYRERRPGRISGFLVLLNLLLLAAAVAIPLLEERQYLVELDTRLNAAKREAQSASEVARQVDALRAQLRFLGAIASDRLTAVELLEELSARLPDNTWVFRLELRAGTVHVHGSSVAASALIATLEDSELFSDVRFASPVLREGNTGRERFHLTARVAPEPGDGAAQGSG